MTDQPLHRAELARRTSQRHIREQRRRVPVRAVRRHARQAERQARARRAPRRPARATARASRASPPATSASSRTTPTWPRCPTSARFTPLPWKPDVARFACDVHVEGEEWPYCPRTILRRQLERARALGYEFMIGAELEYFLVRTRDDGSIELADPLDTLDQPCYDMRALTRNLDFVSQVSRYIDGARLGQLRDRPRGRQRPVRAELRVRRRAHHLRPRDLLPLHGRVARAGARPDRDVHAQAVRPPDRQRLPLPHEPLARRRERLRGATRPTTRAGSGLSETAYHFIGGLKAHAKAYIARDRADGHAPTSGSSSASRSGSSWAPGLRELRLQQPHADAARARRRAAWRTARSTARATPTSAAAAIAGRRPRRDRARPRPGRADHRAQPARADRGASAPSSASSCCRRTCSTPRASSSADDVLREALGNTGARGLRRLLRAGQAATSSTSGTTRSPSGRSTATCSCSEARLRRARCSTQMPHGSSGRCLPARPVAAVSPRPASSLPLRPSPAAVGTAPRARLEQPQPPRQPRRRQRLQQQRQRRSPAPPRSRSTSLSGTPRPASTPTSAAGTTPVSRVQHRKAISFRSQAAAAVRQHAGEHGERPRDQQQRRPARRAPGSRLSPSVVERDVRPQHDEDDQRHEVGQVERERAHLDCSCGECIARPRCSMLPTISPARNAPR